MEEFAKFPISTNFENGEPRLLLVALDIQDTATVVFDSYEKKNKTKKAEYDRYGRVKLDGSVNSSEEYEEFEHSIRDEDGIKSDFILKLQISL